MNESTIPVVDHRDYYREGTKEAFIQEVRDALHSVGFFGVKHTGVDQKIINDLYTSLVTFFAFGQETKMEVSAALTLGQRGYVGFGGESAKGNGLGDVKEYYMIGRDLSDELLKEHQLFKNQWPQFMAFEAPATAFYKHLEGYSSLLQEIFSLALYQERDFLSNIWENGDTSCRMIHYPNRDSEEGAVWAGAHTDINLCTILPRPTKEGLEVKDSDGNWIPVFVKEDAFIINAGDFLEIFSNGYFRSSVHRVRKPKTMDSDRYSCVYFVHPRSKAHLYPLQEFVEMTGGEEKYIKATRWEMLMERLADNNQASDEMLKELSESKLLERLMKVGRASKEAMQAVSDAGYASTEIEKELEKSKT